MTFDLTGNVAFHLLRRSCGECLVNSIFWGLCCSRCTSFFFRLVRKVCKEFLPAVRIDLEDAANQEDLEKGCECLEGDGHWSLVNLAGQWSVVS